MKAGTVRAVAPTASLCARTTTGHTPDAAFNPAWSPDGRGPDELALGIITTIRYDGIRNASWTASCPPFRRDWTARS